MKDGDEWWQKTVGRKELGLFTVFLSEPVCGVEISKDKGPGIFSNTSGNNPELRLGMQLGTRSRPDYIEDTVGFPKCLPKAGVKDAWIIAAVMNEPRHPLENPIQ